MNRVVRCTIEMDLIEVRDFYPAENDEHARLFAARAFEDMLVDLAQTPRMREYIQTKIVEEAS